MLSYFLNFSGTDAARASKHAFGRTIDQRTQTLHVGSLLFTRFDVGVGHLVAAHPAFIANFADHRSSLRL